LRGVGKGVMALNDLRGKIFICHHKPYWICETAVITPIQVGRAIAAERLPMLGDDMGVDNISTQNRQFCELTAMYWVWKNMKLDFIGFGHYRRYLCFSEKPAGRIMETPFPVIELPHPDLMSAERLQEFGICNDAEIIEYVKKYDIILPEPVGNPRLSLERQYKCCHIPADWDAMVQILVEKYPAYQNSVQKVFRSNWQIYPYNMFVMRFDLFCEYMAWLFDVLFELRQRIKISDDPYQQRVLGFLSERMLTLFVVHKAAERQLRIRTLKTVMPELDG
jgi:hypothetical protein